MHSYLRRDESQTHCKKIYMLCVVFVLIRRIGKRMKNGHCRD